ncbi:hypothetical protein [Companilactobacillus sp.]|jgi:hypothetical protein|uniref:hypothetical protein n=1 Tax=Companilactobacillus sp. TaxID=2767905 RepID=UPI0025C65041|nr:hypothetical protein [Companilactobacillus sp.]MCH4009925.1 hypothetical protein [Companilactobacillus sp.]MCH4052399.1 hypothetical protein [Companilactobacillus sp.]MCH4077867.1 hypothetical protein [Companilactobacillus sp.]MCH4126443.1 hypothetical protein [Companilactobacillus sp.]MCH4132029.1 hypothetical protein [Companilactobacillus sp.]
MKKLTKSLLVSATVLLSLAPAATLAAGATTVNAADNITYDEAGHWNGPSLDVQYNNAYQVKTGASQSDLTHISSDALKVVTAYTGETVASHAQGDATLYKTSQGAVLQQPSQAVENPTAKAGETYYQRVLVQIDGLDTENALLSMKFPYTTARILFNGAAMTYANYAGIKGNFAIYRKVIITDNPNNTKPNTDGPEVLYTDNKANGTVTTQSKTGTTKLYDPEGNVIKNRALGPNTDWYTDTQRVMNDGKVYYRVSTSEWVAETDINYYPTATTTATN